MPRRVPQRPAAPRPQTARCRFADDSGARCPSIATRDGLCQSCADQLARGLGSRSALDDLVSGLFGVRPVTRQRMVEAATEVGADLFGRRFPAAAGAPGPAPAAGRPRVTPEQIERRKRILAARGTMGFAPDEVLDEAKIRKQRQQLGRLYHSDGRSKDEIRDEMMRKVNDAADLLIKVANRQG